MNARAWAVVALALLGCAPQVARKPNVVVILIDTLRPDHLPFHGYATNTAPFLSELSAGGATFQRAWSSSSWTAPATASVFTSLYPQQHGVLEGFFVHRTRTFREGATKDEAETITLGKLAGAAPSLPELFRDAGWSTWGITANVNVTERLGFDRGFQHFRTLTGPEYGKGGAAGLVRSELDQFAREMRAAEPYFLYLHFNDVHSPWPLPSGAPPESANELATIRAAYDAQIELVDRTLRECFDALGWERDTLVCVISDHGEEFEEHGARGHGLSLYRELLQVTWLLWSPGRVRDGVEIEANASLVDVLPTLCELADVAPPPGIEGRSLAGLVATRSTLEPPAKPLFAHRKGKQQSDDLWSVIAGDWKLIERAGVRELYDLRDRNELENLAAAQPEVVARLASELERFRARAVPIGSEQVELELDARAIENLKALGYTK